MRKNGRIPPEIEELQSAMLAVGVSCRKCEFYQMMNQEVSFCQYADILLKKDSKKTGSNDEIYNSK